AVAEESVRAAGVQAVDLARAIDAVVGMGLDGSAVLAVRAVDAARAGNGSPVARGADKPDFARGPGPAAAVDRAAHESTGAIERRTAGGLGHVQRVGEAIGDIGDAHNIRLGDEAIPSVANEPERDEASIDAVDSRIIAGRDDAGPALFRGAVEAVG